MIHQYTNPENLGQLIVNYSFKGKTLLLLEITGLDIKNVMYHLI